MTKLQTALEKLLAFSQELGDASALCAILAWDNEINVPEKGAPYRIRLMQKAQADRHNLFTGTKLSKLLEPLIDIDSGKIQDTSLSPRYQAMLREFRRDFLLENKLPTSFIKKEAKVTADTTRVWKEAKESNNFKKMVPALNKMLDIQRKKAEYLAKPGSPYNSLCDLYEPDMTTDQLDSIFGGVKPKLLKLIRNRVEKDKNTNTSFLEANFPTHKQRELSCEVIKFMGITKDIYTLSECSHPFLNSFNPRDARINTKFYKDDFTRGFYATIHEAGHAYYELNLPEDTYGSPLSQSTSLGIHESQSRFWECYIGQSLPFCKYFYPKIQAAFPDVFKNVSTEEFYKAINRVQPTYIRIFADELTYPCHVIMRYELERAMIEGTLAVKDLPDAWNAKIHEYLNLPAPSMQDGCLQDIHWSFGLWGYFPTYSLGTMFAGSLFKQMIKEHGDWDMRLFSGDTTFINTFLKNNIHKYGREFSSIELIEKCTKKPYNTNDYFNYLEGKYA